MCYNINVNGLVAQLGERCVRNAEVGSSTLLESTKKGVLAQPGARHTGSVEVTGSIPVYSMSRYECHLTSVRWHFLLTCAADHVIIVLFCAK